MWIAATAACNVASALCVPWCTCTALQPESKKIESNFSDTAFHCKLLNYFPSFRFVVQLANSCCMLLHISGCNNSSSNTVRQWKVGHDNQMANTAWHSRGEQYRYLPGMGVLAGFSAHTHTRTSACMYFAGFVCGHWCIPPVATAT